MTITTEGVATVATETAKPTSSILEVTGLGKAYGRVPRGRSTSAGTDPTATASIAIASARRNGRIAEVPLAVQDVSFALEPGEFFTLLGPSGCGKTTTLRCIAGLETPTTGRIAVGDRTLYDADQRVNVPASDRRLGMVFQSYAIWPHMSVFKNASFPLEVMPRRERPAKAEIARRVREALRATELTAFEKRSATAMSGGQQQRLALARGLVINPQLLLLDEPLSNLDAKLRDTMRFELKRLQHEYGITMVYVTHDQTEALTLSSRIAVMNKGRIVQIGNPREIYENPRSRFVADFVGVTTFLDGAIGSVTGQELQLTVPGFGSVVVRGSGIPSDLPLTHGGLLSASVRPEWVTLSEGRTDSGPNRWDGVVVARAFVGESVEHVVRVGDLELRNRSNPAQSIPEDTPVQVSVDPARIAVVPMPDDDTKEN